MCRIHNRTNKPKIGLNNVGEKQNLYFYFKVHISVGPFLYVLGKEALFLQISK